MPPEAVVGARIPLAPGHRRGRSACWRRSPRARLRRPTRSLLLFGLAVGALTGASQLAYFAAVARSGIAIPTHITNGLGPILTAVGQTVIFRQRPDGRTLISMAAALSGLALLVLDGPGDVTAEGVVLAIVAAITYAA